MNPVLAEEFTYEDGVVVLTDANFDDASVKFNEFLVDFYAPWCGYCQALQPEFEAAANTLLMQGSRVTLAKVDMNENPELKERF